MSASSQGCVDGISCAFFKFCVFCNIETKKISKIKLLTRLKLKKARPDGLRSIGIAVAQAGNWKLDLWQLETRKIKSYLKKNKVFFEGWPQSELYFLKLTEHTIQFILINSCLHQVLNRGLLAPQADDLSTMLWCPTK